MRVLHGNGPRGILVCTSSFEFNRESTHGVLFMKTIWDFPVFSKILLLLSCSPLCHNILRYTDAVTQNKLNSILIYLCYKVSFYNSYS